jgi:predicted Zn finger-like uncharacterized protein
MQTQCPHCRTRFRVTQSQVDTADGFVRCSVCKQVFNALEVAEQHEPQKSLHSQAHVVNAHDEIVTGTDAGTDDIQTAAHYTPADADEVLADERTQEKSDIDAPDISKTSATDTQRKDAYDFFDEDSSESRPHVVPESFKDPYLSRTPGLISSLLWGVGILLLTATLLVEYAWFNRDQLNRISQLKVWTEKLCQHIECKDISMRAPEKIELISRNVYSHPNEKNALMVNVTMKNTADFAQPFPIMQVNFSDVRGGDVAARRFLPTEYLPEEIQSNDSEPLILFEPGTNLTFIMEIKDPGKQAMTYEFNFL